MPAAGPGHPVHESVRAAAAGDPAEHGHEPAGPRVPAGGGAGAVGDDAALHWSAHARAPRVME